MTVEKLYDKWTSEYFKALKSDSSVRTIKSAWLYCSSVYNMRASDIRARHIKATSLGSKYLINCTDTTTHRSSIMFTYDKYQQRFIKIRDKLKFNPEHRAHDGRMHFITMAKKCKVDEYAIKYIVGHSINDITEKVYTKREVEWLQEEIAKIK